MEAEEEIEGGRRRFRRRVKEMANAGGRERKQWGKYLPAETRTTFSGSEVRSLKRPNYPPSSFMRRLEDIHSILREKAWQSMAWMTLPPAQNCEVDLSSG